MKSTILYIIKSIESDNLSNVRVIGASLDLGLANDIAKSEISKEKSAYKSGELVESEIDGMKHYRLHDSMGYVRVIVEKSSLLSLE